MNWRWGTRGRAQEWVPEPRQWQRRETRNIKGEESASGGQLDLEVEKVVSGQCGFLH